MSPNSRKRCRRRRSRGSSKDSPPERIVNEARTKVLYPETLKPTICLRVPEMKNELSYWQIGGTAAQVTRLKINTLRADVKIKTEESGFIPGSFSELYNEVPTLGTAIIHIFEKPVKVYVTRSKQAAPIVCDGILGNEFLKRIDFSYKPEKYTLFGIPASVPILMGEDLIPNYTTTLKARMKKAAIAFEKGAWADISDKLRKLRHFLPPEVAEDDRPAVVETLEEFVDCFHSPGDKLTCTKLLKYEIRSRNNNVINVPQPELSSEDWDEIDVQIDYLLRNGIIRASTSAYNSPVRLIARKPDSHGNARRCLAPDYHELNKNSEGDAFPIPDIVELTDLLYGSKYFSVFDLASACYQIALEPEDREKSAFSTRTDRYEFLRMPLGIKNASQKIQRLLNLVIDEMLYSPSIAFVSYDDIIVHSSTLEEHEVRVRKLLSRIEDAGLKLQPAKCQMFSKSVRYLGYFVTDQGLCPDPEKIRKIREYELPKTRPCLSSFLGLLSLFKRFIPNHAERVKPMSNLFKNNDHNLSWTSEAVRSFDDMKRAFSQQLLLRYPNWKETFILETNASDVGIQAALLQKNWAKGNDLPIAYASRTYTPAELSYNKHHRARLAAMYGMDTWYWYLSDGCDRKFILRTPEPRAFDWYLKRQFHNSDELRRFEMSYSGKEFTVETLRSSK